MLHWHLKEVIQPGTICSAMKCHESRSSKCIFGEGTASIAPWHWMPIVLLSTGPHSKDEFATQELLRVSNSPGASLTKINLRRLNSTSTQFQLYLSEQKKQTVLSSFVSGATLLCYQSWLAGKSPNQKFNGRLWTYMSENHRTSCLWHGSLNVPIEHHPTIRYMVYNGYYKVMSNIPKMGHLPTPEWAFHGELPEGMWCSAAPPESGQELKARQLPIPTSLQRTLLPEHGNLLCGQRPNGWNSRSPSEIKRGQCSMYTVPDELQLVSRRTQEKNESPYWDRHTRMEMPKKKCVKTSMKFGCQVVSPSNTIFHPSAPCCWWLAHEPLQLLL